MEIICCRVQSPPIPLKGGIWFKPAPAYVGGNFPLESLSLRED